ncbi:transmembrane protein 17B [Aplysia californica]|uniref:Transmembrane protein 17B n=1 Tax=Aplysia californica TaxID=6500 RepID=A0ABM0JVQ9_APLCA|nr:transmembrane protein 17B [Aplysia californica]
MVDTTNFNKMDSTLTKVDERFRRTMTSVTDLLFPVSKTKDQQKQQIIRKSHEYVTNLPLQMALYFNCFFFPLWLIGSLVILELKWEYLDDLYRIVLAAVYIVYFIIEIVRLYLGYLGNLMERVPELAGSWLLTLLLSTPLILLLNINDSAILLPMERALHLIMGIFVLFEVVIGYFAIRAMVNYQVTKYHLQQFSDLENMDDSGDYFPESRYTS